MNPTRRQTAKSNARLVGLVSAALAVGTMSTSVVAANVAGAAVRKQVTVSVETVSKMGKVLDVNGKAVYVLSPAGSKCDSSCLAIWPALTLPAGINSATAAKGVAHGKLGTTAGANGVRQVTYQGQPLYFFSGDTTRGKVKGNVTDQWGKWTAVVVGKTPSSSGGGSGGGNSGTNAGSGGASF